MMNMHTPNILTIILNYKTPELTLKSCAAALREMEGLDGEIVVIDNGSGDDSFVMLSQAAEQNGWTQNNRVRVLDSGHNGGFGAGMNFGMQARLSDGSVPDFYYLLNSDAWPDPHAITKLRDYLIENPKVGLVGSAIRGTDNTPHPTAFRFPSLAGDFEAAAQTGLITRWMKDAVVRLPIPETDTKVDWTAGASLMIRRAVIDQTGGFDETFFLYFEETDLCRRAAQAGWSTHYLPESRVVHIGSASTGMKTWSRTPSYWFDSRQHYYTKSKGFGYFVASTLALIAGGLIWRFRRLIQTLPQVDPDWFLTDLTTHLLRAPFRKTATRSPTISVPISEDQT